MTDTRFEDLAAAVYASPALAADDYAAPVFADWARPRFRYCDAFGWVAWSGRVWERDPHRVRVLAAAAEWATQLHGAVERVVVSHLARNPKAPGVPATIKSLLYVSSLEALVKLAAGRLSVPVTAFDADLDLLCCRNGVVDLRTGHLMPHDPARFVTRCTGVDYVPRATHPDLTAMLGCVDDDVRGWLQRLAGYCATGHINEDVLAVFDGDGANGKSTVVRAMWAALGDYALYADPALLTGDRHAAIRAQLRGGRFVAIVETEEGAALRLSAVKALTGGDPISAQHMRGEWFEFVPQFTLVVATNHRPKVNDTSHSAWRRLRLVPFPHRYTPTAEPGRDDDRPEDTKLRERVAAGDQQRQAVLAWIVAGAIQWYEDGLGACDDIAKATLQWRGEEDVVARFVDDEILFRPSSSVGATMLWQRIRDWYSMENRPSGSQKNAMPRFLEHDIVVAHDVYKAKDDRGLIRYHGLELVPEDESPAYQWMFRREGARR